MSVHFFSPPAQSVGLHVLGQEAVVAQEEAALAAGHARRGARRHCAGRRHRGAGHDHRHSGVGRPQSAQSLQGRRQAQAQRCRPQRRAGIGELLGFFYVFLCGIFDQINRK